MSVSEFDENLDACLAEILRKEGIQQFFQVQKVVVPKLLESIEAKLFPPRDVCVSAPTGSGKTLCYVLPIVQALKNRRIRRIRALIVVPVVNLAKQVYDVFSVYARGTDLKTVLITGKQNFQSELDALYEIQSEIGLMATCDVVVATPGRLLDHLRSNPKAFSLKFLRFLVMDEADRLMNDFRLDWLSEVETAVYKNIPNNEIERFRLGSGTISELIAFGTLPLQKILLSATLSHNPELLKQLNLFQPIYINIGDGNQSELNFQSSENIGIPLELDEYYAKCQIAWKPLVVFCLIERFQWKKVLCFVSKRESSLRLAHLLGHLGLKNVTDATARLNKFRMERILKKFAKGEIGVIICSDLMARGMDISGIDCVINYDAPKLIRTYVHRVGRTARAGVSGVSVTLTDENEFTAFQTMLEQADHFKNLKELEIASSELEERKEEYTRALNSLRDDTEREKIASKKQHRSLFRNTKRKKFKKI